MLNVGVCRIPNVSEDHVEIGRRRQGVVEGDDGKTRTGKGVDMGFGQVLALPVEQAAAVKIQDSRLDGFFGIEIHCSFFSIVGMIEINYALHGARSFLDEVFTSRAGRSTVGLSLYLPSYIRFS